MLLARAVTAPATNELPDPVPILIAPPAASSCTRPASALAIEMSAPVSVRASSEKSPAVVDVTTPAVIDPVFE
jgi:hypothetical protein